MRLKRANVGGRGVKISLRPGAWRRVHAAWKGSRDAIL
jgi:hypothetical protein